jgi:hypothetical protein
MNYLKWLGKYLIVIILSIICHCIYKKYNLHSDYLVFYLFIALAFFPELINTRFAQK